MELFWEQFLGLFYLIFAVIWLIRRDKLTDNLLGLLQSNGTMMLSGIIALFTGLAIVLTHSVGEDSSRVLVEIIGFLAIGKGVYLISNPHGAGVWYKRFLSSSYEVIWLITIVGLGGILTYLGFAR